LETDLFTLGDIRQGLDGYLWSTKRDTHSLAARIKMVSEILTYIVVAKSLRGEEDSK